MARSCSDLLPKIRTRLTVIPMWRGKDFEREAYGGAVFLTALGFREPQSLGPGGKPGKCVWAPQASDQERPRLVRDIGSSVSLFDVISESLLRANVEHLCAVVPDEPPSM